MRGVESGNLLVSDGRSERERPVGGRGWGAARMSERRTVRDLRRSNRSVVLTKLYRVGPLSRQEVSVATSLSQASVSNLVGELLEDGLVEEAGSVDSDGGRPIALLRVAPRYGYIVGVDVGETRIQT